MSTQPKGPAFRTIQDGCHPDVCPPTRLRVTLPLMTSIDATLGLNADAAPPSAMTLAPLAQRASSGRASRRFVGTVVAGACAALLLLAAWMKPSEDGLGTHQQLNMPPCGWILLMDCPCPTCGMTTAVSYAAHGNLLRSFWTQPLGFAFALATTMAMFIGTYTAATGSRVGIVLAGMWTRRATWWLIAFAMASWLFKIAAYKGLL